MTLDLWTVSLPWRHAKWPDRQRHMESGRPEARIRKLAKRFAPVRLIQPGSETPIDHMTPLWAAVDCQRCLCWSVHIGGSVRASAGPKVSRSALVVVAAGGDADLVLGDLVDEAVLVGDAA
jgi:hypothetical protein